MEKEGNIPREGGGVEAGHLTVRKFAEEKKRSTQWVYLLLHSGRVKYIRSMGSGQILIPRSELEKVATRPSNGNR